MNRSQERISGQSLSRSTVSSRTKPPPLHISKPLMQKICQVVERDSSLDLDQPRDLLTVSKVSLQDDSRQLRPSERIVYENKVQQLQEAIYELELKACHAESRCRQVNHGQLEIRLQTLERTNQLLSQQNLNLKRQLKQASLLKDLGTESGFPQQLKSLQAQLFKLGAEFKEERHLRRQAEEQLLRAVSENQELQRRVASGEQRLANLALQKTSEEKKSKKWQLLLRETQSELGKARGNEKRLKASLEESIARQASESSEQGKMIVKFEEQQKSLFQQNSQLRQRLMQLERAEAQLLRLKSENEGLDKLLHEKQMELRETRESCRTQRNYYHETRHLDGSELRLQQLSSELEKLEQENRRLLALVATLQREQQGFASIGEGLAHYQGLAEKNAQLTTQNLARLSELEQLRLQSFELEHDKAELAEELLALREESQCAQEALRAQLLGEREEVKAKNLQLQRLRSLLELQKQNCKQFNREMEKLVMLCREKQEQVSVQLRKENEVRILKYKEEAQRCKELEQTHKLECEKLRDELQQQDKENKKGNAFREEYRRKLARIEQLRTSMRRVLEDQAEMVSA